MTDPQNIDWAPYEKVTVRVTMSETTDITGGTFSLNVRDEDGEVIYQTTAASLENPTVGIFSFTIASADTGAMAYADRPYDIWRTDSGNEKQLVHGTLTVRRQQWQ